MLHWLQTASKRVLATCARFTDKPYLPNGLWLFGEPGRSSIHVAAERVGDDLSPRIARVVSRSTLSRLPVPGNSANERGTIEPEAAMTSAP